MSVIISFYLGGMCAALTMLIGEAVLGRVPEVIFVALRLQPLRTGGLLLAGLLFWPVTFLFGYQHLYQLQLQDDDIESRRVGCMATGHYGSRCEYYWNHDGPHSFTFTDELVEFHRSDEAFFRSNGAFDMANYSREMADAAEKGVFAVYMGFHE